MTTASAPVLIFGGTADARRLAELLDGAGVPVLTSLAGRVREPQLPAGEVRVGGFGGADAIAEWLVRHRPPAVVDATHPFAARIGPAVAQACAAAGVPLLRLERPGWSERPGDRWRWVADLDEAAAALDGRDARVLLTTGRQGLASFTGVESAWFLIRSIEAPEPPVPPRHEVLLDRGPYTVAGELEVIDRHAIDVVVTKDSGGAATEAKLEAARERGLEVIVVRRPPRPDVAAVASARDAAAWVEQVAGRAPAQVTSRSESR
ncbi:MAG TPA: cobalt-precorrin-6A reductase [Solirubrobacteraceae bacterium]|jgi:precorrin-6A/cobalt-precorrin-6A reductase|nr:cobalt-precorrin-6A reductase [Solirubrobacteraceae bacterium]